MDLSCCVLRASALDACACGRHAGGWDLIILLLKIISKKMDEGDPLYRRLQSGLFTGVARDCSHNALALQRW